MFSDFVVVVVGKKLRDQKSAAAAAASEMEMDWDKFLEGGLGVNPLRI